MIRFVISAILMISGLVCILLSIFGVFKFRFVLNRMHCAAIIDTLGTLLILAGLMVSCEAPVYLLKLLAILIFLWIGSPIASHLVARTELLTDDGALSHIENEKEIEEKKDDIL